LWQARLVRDTIARHVPGSEPEIVEVRTTGDRITDRALFEIGGKGLFTKELEEGLLGSTLDLAVHSLKDLPTELPENLRVGAVLERGAPGDALVTTRGFSLETLPKGALIGTSSLRRRAQLRALRPECAVADLRGNLDTRLKKLSRGDIEGMVAARAGLDRLGWDREAYHVEDLEDFLPAPGQGAVAVEVRSDREELGPVLEALNHAETDSCVRAERAFLSALGGGCHVPVGALARLQNGRMSLRGLVASVEGDRVIRREAESGNEPEALGLSLAREVIAAGARTILDELEREGNS